MVRANRLVFGDVLVIGLSAFWIGVVCYFSNLLY